MGKGPQSGLAFLVRIRSYPHCPAASPVRTSWSVSHGHRARVTRLLPVGCGKQSSRAFDPPAGPPLCPNPTLSDASKSNSLAATPTVPPGLGDSHWPQGPAVVLSPRSVLWGLLGSPGVPVAGGLRPRRTRPSAPATLPSRGGGSALSAETAVILTQDPSRCPRPRSPGRFHNTGSPCRGFCSPSRPQPPGFRQRRSQDPW